MKNWKRIFFVFIVGQAFSVIGSQVVQFAIVWYLTLQTKSAITLTLSIFVSFIPPAFLSPLAGVVADRYNRRKIMMLADGFVAFTTLILIILFIFFDKLPIPIIFIIIFLRSIGQTFHGPAIGAALPLLVPEDKITQSSGWNSLLDAGGALIGPMLGAVLMASFPIKVVLLLDIIGAVFAIFSLFFIHIPDVASSKEKKHFFKEITHGFVAMKNNKILVLSLPQIMAFGILYVPLSSIFPLLVVAHYKGGVIEIGFVDLCFSLGMIISSIFLGVFGGRLRKMAAISIAIIIVGLGSIGCGWLSPPFFFLVLFILAFMGMAGACCNTLYYAYIQESTPKEDLGRVLSILMMSFTFSSLIGLSFSGAISEIVGVPKWFVIVGILVAINGLVLYVRTKKAEDEYLRKKEEEKEKAVE